MEVGLVVPEDQVLIHAINAKRRVNGYMVMVTVAQNQVVMQTPAAHTVAKNSCRRGGSPLLLQINTMKIVQSFWSCGKNINNESFGWYAPQFHIMAWAFSALQLRKYYDHVELYTDQNGYEVLIEQIGLPYTATHVCYDDIHHYAPALWAVPKIKTYAAQNEPFLHVDGDVFIWKPFSKRLANAPLIVQNYEKGTTYYGRMMEQLQKKMTYIPPILEEALKQESIDAVNAGIMGGCDIGFYKSYTDQALALIKENEAVSRIINFNILFEQVLFYQLAKTTKKKIHCHFPKKINDDGYSKELIADLFTLCFKGKYAHLIGPHKRNVEICEVLGRTLLKEYPDYFFRIIYMFRDQHARFNSHIRHLKAFTAVVTSHQAAGINLPAPYYRTDKMVKGTDKAESAYAYEKELAEFKQEWDNLSAIRLYDMELRYGMPASFFMGNMLLYKISRHPEMRVLETYYDWTAPLTCQSVEGGRSDVALTVACVPELFYEGWKELLLDDLEFNILAALDEDMCVGELIAVLKDCFLPCEDEEAADAAMLDLLGIKFKRLLQYKLVGIYK